MAIGVLSSQKRCIFLLHSAAKDHHSLNNIRVELSVTRDAEAQRFFNVTSTNVVGFQLGIGIGHWQHFHSGQPN
jgi:hypothetical protein